MTEIELSFMFRITIETTDVRRIEDSPWGTYIVVGVGGGTVEGPALNGQVLNCGGDWGLEIKQGQGEASKAVTELDAKLMIQAADESLVQMTYGGVSYYLPNAGNAQYQKGEIKDPSTYYFRTTPRFQTSSPAYERLNRIVTVATGLHRQSAGPIYDVYEVL